MYSLLVVRRYADYLRPRYNYSLPDYRYVLSRGTELLPRRNYRDMSVNTLSQNHYQIVYEQDLAQELDYQDREIEILPSTPSVAELTPELIKKRKLALLLPGHNEELIIQTTITSAIAAGMDRSNIYVVDDCSSDATRAKAIELLGQTNVLTVERSGKARAVSEAIKYFNFEKYYHWLHISDADSIFGESYFKIYRTSLKGGKYVAAVGFVQSLRGNWIANYRAFSYTYGQHVIRRWQSWFGMITVLPGPTTCFRTDILNRLDFTIGSITEDFDLTLQIHRYKIGKILYIPDAINYTQDPKTLHDFCKQTLRWQRGFFQGVRTYRIGRRLQPIDISIGYTLFQMVTYLIEMGIVVPYLIYATGRWEILPVVLGADFLVVCVLAVFSSSVTKRLSILASLPYYYFMRWLEMGIFIRAFVEVIILKRFTAQTVGWETEGRRFNLDTNALRDAAS